eukprot:TRINITY_DN10662_c0_g1_i4.p5 TRINITY_DN10662_c0_g1~~TRINITY_DN10662_c0_g1_i4.p5  ORF type:complete len:120 (+),score=6.26 TRINITY_DN10662_c0_g1_i4:1939-2298(+)
MEKPQIIEHIHHSVNYTLFGGSWVPASARCVLYGQHAKGTGALQILSMEKGKLNLQKEVSKQNGFKCGTFNFSSFEERHLALGDFDGELTTWYAVAINVINVYSIMVPQGPRALRTANL